MDKPASLVNLVSQMALKKCIKRLQEALEKEPDLPTILITITHEAATMWTLPAILREEGPDGKETLTYATSVFQRVFSETFEKVYKLTASLKPPTPPSPTIEPPTERRN